MIRVGLNLCWLVPGDVGGSEQATVRALRGLIARDDVEVVVFCLAAFAEAHPDVVAAVETHVAPASRPLSAPGRGRVARAASKPLRVLVETVWLPRAVARSGVDVLHDAGGTSPGRVRVPRVLGIHDIQPLDLPRNFHPVKVAWLRRMIPSALARAAVVVVPSRFVRDRLEAVLGVDPERVVVAPWSTPDVVAPDDEQRRLLADRFGIADRVVVQAAITYPHKNHAVTVAAFGRIAARHPDAQLVLAGGEGPAESAVATAVAASGVADRIVRTGRLDDAAVATVLADARVVVVPSAYEGFGIPALEAMAAGTPVVVADAGSLPEVVADAGVVVPVGDDAQLAIAMHHALVDSDARDRRIEAGLERAAHFSTERTAAALVQAYAAAYRSHRAGR